MRIGEWRIVVGHPDHCPERLWPVEIVYDNGRTNPAYKVVCSVEDLEGLRLAINAILSSVPGGGS